MERKNTGNRVLIILVLGLCCTISFNARTQSAQPPQHPYPCATVKIFTTRNGSLFYDGNFLTNISIDDWVKIKGVTEGIHLISLKTPLDSIKESIKCSRDTVYKFIIKEDSLLPVSQRYYSELKAHEFTAIKRRPNNTKGCFNITSLECLLINLSDLKDPVTVLSGISTIIGYRFSPYFSLGAGIAIEQNKISADFGYYSPPYKVSYTSVKDTLYFLPVFLDFRGYLTKGRVVPYGFLDAGYVFSINNGITKWIPITGLKSYQYDISSNGIYLACGAGVRFILHHNFALNTGLKFTYRNVTWSNDFYYLLSLHSYNVAKVHLNTNKTMYLLGLDLGLSF